ncbi:MAG TPA: AAA family ATPase [Gaiellaceae bacterium]|nr:AAA family ATPase [Gaiellaceae bacterium]
MSDTIRVYFTGDCEGFEALRRALAEHDEIESVGESEHVAAAASALAGGHLECVLHATRAAEFPATEIAAIREQTRAPIILVASGGEAARMLEQALELDVADVVLLPQLLHNVVFAIRKASHVRRQLQTSAHHGKVVTVFSPKGGTGKTVVSTNLAALMAKREGKRTLLLDLDLQFGDAAIVLGMEPEKTIYDLVVAPGELDSEKLAGYVTKHQSGIDVLAAPMRPEDAELVIESKVTGLLEVARASYDVIVVDTSPFFHGPMLATLDRTDELLVLCGLDVPTLKNVRLALQTLELLSFPSSRIRYVMNRASANVGLKTREVEAGLKVKIGHELPTDRAVQICVNRGEPVVLAEPRCEFSRALAAMAKQVNPPTAARRPGSRRRMLSFAKA